MKPVFIGVSPNLEVDDLKLNFKLLFSRQKEDSRSELAQAISKELNVKETSEVYLLDSARSAFYFILRTLNFPPGSEVLLPGFTCVVIVNPVLWCNLIPKFVDIDLTTFNTSIPSLLANVTPKTKAILVQHTFGAVIDTMRLKEELNKLGREDIIIVEDLAHSLGGKYRKNENTSLGTAADYTIVTFGMEKMISTIRGGGVIANKQNEKFKEEYNKLGETPRGFVLKLLVNPIFWALITPIYYLGIGKFTLGRIIVSLGHKTGFLGIAISSSEYYGGRPAFIPAKLARPLAKLGILQISKLKRFNEHRRELAIEYSKRLANTKYVNNPEQQFIQQVINDGSPHTFMRYPLVLESRAQRDALMEKAKAKKIVLGDWYKTMFYTKKMYLAKLKYSSGMCPNAEDLAGKIINLPTAINMTKEHLEVLMNIITGL